MTTNNEKSPGFRGQEAPVWQIHTDSTVFEAEIMEVPILSDNFDMFNLKNTLFVWKINMLYGKTSTIEREKM